MRRIIMLLGLLVATAAPGKLALAPAPGTWGDLPPGPHDVGFLLIEATDTSRSIRPDHAIGKTWPRPVRIHVWYPAKESPDATPLTFGRYADGWCRGRRHIATGNAKREAVSRQGARFP